MTKIFNKQFNLIFLLIILVELISFAGHLFPLINIIAFFILTILVLILALYKIEYGIAVLLTELFVGSMGHLFHFTFSGITISWRIALWLIIMFVWFSNVIIAWIKNKKLSITFCESSFFKYFIILFVFIICGIINGFIHHNQLNNIFFDFNGWLYFLLIFPIYEILQQEKNIYLIGQIFIASSIWIGIETLFLFFAFSHSSAIAPFVLYNWIRDTRVGEITLIQNGFFRIFLQSQIFILVNFFFASIVLIKSIVIKKQQNFIINFLLLILSLSTILISFSRSFWLGLIVGILICLLILLFIIKINFKHFLLINCYWLLIFISSIILIISIAKFPYPTPINNFDAINIFSDRASQFEGEAGASSRWALLPKLWAKIIKSPIIGQGFGATIIYQTKDPRVIESNPSGEYTTYAFEWGWLDIWLKLGFLGLLAYLIIIIKLFLESCKLISHKQNWTIFGLTIGALVIAIVSISSPYLNHPLGIGYLILVIALLNYYQNYQKLA